MARAALAGGCYFLIVFAAGFLLGALRALVIAPRLGETGAVLAEMPVMLTIAWLACRALTARLRLPAALPARLAMGGVAFALLICAEAALGLVLGRGLRLDTAPGLLGLAGQVAFALLPVLQLRR